MRTLCFSDFFPEASTGDAKDFRFLSFLIVERRVSDVQRFSLVLSFGLCM